jgi:uncharacterized repeat protein (TIGR02543 family)
VRKLKLLIAVIVLSLTSSVFVASPILASSSYDPNSGNGTVECITSGIGATGWFTVQDNVVISSSSCAGEAVIPAGVTHIGNDAFWGEAALESVLFEGGSGLLSIVSVAFGSTTRLYSITLPSSVTAIGSSAFWGASSITRINIPKKVKNIEESTFAYAWDLQTVTFASGSELETIGDSAFRDAMSLSSIEIPFGVTSIGEYAFNYTIGLSQIKIPGSVTSIGSYAFFNSYHLESVTFENESSLTTIGSYAFSQTSSLASISIPRRVSSIGSHAFYRAWSLRWVYFLGNAPAIVGSRNFANDGEDLPKAIITPGATGFAPIGETWNGLTIGRVHVVSYDSSGGTPVNSNTFISFEEIETQPAPPTRTNYIFDGRSATNGGELIRFPYAPSIASDITLYAKWTIDPNYTAALELATRTVGVKKSLVAKKLAKKVGITIVSPKAKLSISVAKSSKKICKKSGSKLKTLKRGNCVVTFTVQEPKPKAGKKPKPTKIRKIFVVR